MDACNSSQTIPVGAVEIDEMYCPLLHRRTKSEPQKDLRCVNLTEKIARTRHSLDELKIKNTETDTNIINTTNKDNKHHDEKSHFETLKSDRNTSECSKDEEKLNMSKINHVKLFLFRKRFKNVPSKKSCKHCKTENTGKQLLDISKSKTSYKSFENIDHSSATDIIKNNLQRNSGDNGDNILESAPPTAQYSKPTIYKEKGEDNVESVISKTNEDSIVPEKIHFVEDVSSSGESLDNGFCLQDYICCSKEGQRKVRSKSCCQTLNNNNDITSELSDSVRQYSKLPQSPPSIVKTDSTCISSISSYPTLSSTDHSITFNSDVSSANLSHDSGFDEPKCFIHLVNHNHKCKGMISCHRKEKANLNKHLKELIDCMPKSFADCEANPRGLLIDAPRFPAKRRNAICETSEEMKLKFNKALHSYMTLQAMAKYDLL